jgi:predicted RNA-binding protein with PIN domain
VALHYLLDAYNIIHQMPSLDRYKLDEQRNGLVHFVEHLRPQGSLKNKVTIVFDGRWGLYRTESKGTEIIFSLDESADDKIKQIVEDAKNPKNIIVVTNDRGIQTFVRKLGAQICSVQDFLSKGRRISKETKEKIDKNGGSTKQISHTAEYKITSEFEKIWLKGKKE